VTDQSPLDTSLVPAPQAAGGRAAARRAAQAPAGASRSEQRRLAEEQARAARSGHALWKAWWVYPLMAGVVVAAYFGIQSAVQAPVREPVVVQTIGTAP
jgi:hypothetical protein